MRDKGEAARRQPGGGAEAGAGASYSRSHSSTGNGAAQRAPLGQVRAELRGELIYRGGRHVAALRGGELQRVYDPTRELMRGNALCFHEDVLRLAAEHGAQFIVVTERASGQAYKIALADFVRLGWRFDHAVFGRQLGLDLGQWQRLPKTGDPVQLSLFEVRP